MIHLNRFWRSKWHRYSLYCITRLYNGNYHTVHLKYRKVSFMEIFLLLIWCQVLDGFRLAWRLATVDIWVTLERVTLRLATVAFIKISLRFVKWKFSSPTAVGVTCHHVTPSASRLVVCWRLMDIPAACLTLTTKWHFLNPLWCHPREDERSPRHMTSGWLSRVVVFSLVKAAKSYRF